MAGIASPKEADSHAEGARRASRTRMPRQRDGARRRRDRHLIASAYRPRTGDWALAATIAWDVLSTFAFFGLLRVAGVVPALVGPQREAISVFARPLPVIFALVAPFVIGAFGGYAARGPASIPLGRLSRLVAAAAITTWLACLASTVLDKHLALGDLAVVSVLLPLVWLIGRNVIELATAVPQRTLIVGGGVVARRAASVAELAGRQLEIVGRVGDLSEPFGDQAPPLLGGIGDLPRLLREQRIDRLLVAFSTKSDEELIRVLRDCDASGVHVDIVPRLFEFVGMESRVSAIGHLPVLQVGARRSGRLGTKAKRGFDVTVAVLALLCLLPVLIAVGVAVALDSGRPILYRQQRVGRRGKRFSILKFRTMIPDADAHAAELISGLSSGKMTVQDTVSLLKREDDPRITRIGRFLRRTSLDELPQLWNVVRGDMSLVGPRPLRPFEVEQLHAWQLVRQDVRPGITGLWQILGRSHLLWDERMQLDYTYVRHWSPLSDIKILGETIPAVFRRAGAR